MEEVRTMATAVEPRTVPIEGEKRFLLRDVGWEGYLTLLRLVGDGAIRITYDRGDAELMSPLLKHERGRSRLARLVEILGEELKIPMIAAGATTLKRKDLDRGLEADASYYINDIARVPEDENLDLEKDPPPDLAIEIEITCSVLPRLGIYGALGVAEIWRSDGQRIKFLARQQDGSYQEMQQSTFLPTISLDEVQRFAVEVREHDDNAWARCFRRWVREEVLARLSAPDGGE
jgi:Uma2 family endonuclease